MGLLIEDIILAYKMAYTNQKCVRFFGVNMELQW